MRIRPRAFVAGALATVAAAGAGWLTLAQGDSSHRALGDDGPVTATPIKHVVVLFDENESYDHYFGTYPNAANNNPSEPVFSAPNGAPASDNYVAHPNLLTANPNSSQPARFARSEALGCGNNHDYSAEQKAFDGGLMDKFPENTGGGCGGKTMNYFDGNTVTALWNYAQHYTMSDNFFGSTFGPSTPGAINLVSGNTHGVNAGNDADGTGTMTSDPNPVDDCGGGSAVMSGQNVGDLLNAHNVTWGWFQGGFKPTAVSGGTATCGSTHKNVGGATITDYSAHHEPFQYYASTANPHHLAPTSTAMIGQTDQANHQYDLTDFDATLAAGNLPQVSFLKAAAYEDAHPGNSDPLDEQQFLVREINAIEASPEWDSTAIFIAYDDSDGWYDHVYAGDAAINPSDAASDHLNGNGVCGTSAPAAGAYRDRCGPGPRLPFLIVSPWVSPNTIHHTAREQTSITQFIEDNWSLGRIGDQSFDARAAPLDTMFDFNGADPRAAKLTLDGSTGNVPGAGPTASPTASATASPTATPTKTPTPTKAKASLKGLAAKAKRSGKKLTVTLTVKAKPGLKTALRLRLRTTKGKQLATKAATLTTKKKSVKIVLKAKKKLKKGKYKLSVSIAQSGRTATAKTFTLKL